MQDLISRQAAIDALYDWSEHSMTDAEAWHIKQVIGDIKSLPSAQPERKTGHWIKTARWGRVYYCDQCRNYLDFDGVNAGRGSANYCPNCGARMDEERDSDHAEEEIL